MTYFSSSSFSTTDIKSLSVSRRRRAANKLKLIVSYNGAFCRLPHLHKLRYTGGETRIISVDRGISFSKLKSRTITELVRPNAAVSGFRYSLKYHISDSFCGGDGFVLISLETDDDVRSMVEEYEAMEFCGMFRKRIWLFVCDNRNESKGDYGFPSMKPGNWNSESDGFYEGKKGFVGIQGDHGDGGFLSEDLLPLLQKGGDGKATQNRSKKFNDDCLRKTVLRQQLLAKKFDAIRVLHGPDERTEIDLTCVNGACEAPLPDSCSEPENSPSLHSGKMNTPLDLSRKMTQPNDLDPMDEEHLKSGGKVIIAVSSNSSSENAAKVGTDNSIKQEIQQDSSSNLSMQEKGMNETMTKCLEANGSSPAVVHANLSTGELQNIRNSDLEFVKEIGSGTFGTVYHGKWKGSDVAIKRIKSCCFTNTEKDVDRLVADFWKEAHILGQLRHPNIVAMYGVASDGPLDRLAAVTEYMVNGSLKQVLRRKDRTIDRRKRLIIAMDATSGMEYLHEKNIVHFDLKSDNFLVNMRDPQRPVCKIGDLGLSKIKQRSLVSGGVRGTLPWMAPELLNGNNQVSEKVDVYSFAIVMWELLTGEEPYEQKLSEAIIAGIIRGDLRPNIPCWCDPAWRSLMERCWSSDPDSRPPFSEIAKELRAMAASMNIK